MTQLGGIYTYTNTNGTQYVFPANGMLNYEQDANNNRITLGYNAQNQLVSLGLAFASGALMLVSTVLTALNHQTATVLHLATGKFPAPGHVLARRALRDEYAAGLVVECRRYHQVKGPGTQAIPRR